MHSAKYEAVLKNGVTTLTSGPSVTSVDDSMILKLIGLSENETMPPNYVLVKLRKCP